MDTQSNLQNIRLNIGAGTTRWGDVRIDVSKTDQLTLLGDMHELPINSNICSEVLLDNVLEHTQNISDVLEEIHRVLQPGGIVYIYVPYYTSQGAYSDPTHQAFFTEQTLDYYTTESDYEYYSDFEFELIDKEFYYSKILKLLPFRQLRLKLGHMIGDLVLAMKVILRKPGDQHIEPSIDGWLHT